MFQFTTKWQDRRGKVTVASTIQNCLRSLNYRSGWAITAWITRGQRRDSLLTLEPGGEERDPSYDYDNLNVKINYQEISFFRPLSLFINHRMRYFIVLQPLGKGQIIVPLAKSLERMVSTYVKLNFPQHSNLIVYSLPRYCQETVKNTFTSEHESHWNFLLQRVEFFKC